MKPHNEATWSFTKLAIPVVGVFVAAGMALGGGDGKSPPPDFSKFSKAFEVKDRGDTPSVKPKRTKEPADQPPPMTCDGDQCWWTDLGKPTP